MNRLSIFTSVQNKLLYICLISIFLVNSIAIFSQISEGGTPPSFQYQQLVRSGTITTKVPIDFNVEDLRETDEWNSRSGVPMPLGRVIPVDYTMDNSGQYTLLPGGENIWRLHLKANDATAIMLYYSDFYIPEGGRLFIYSPDKSQLLGAYTNRTHPSGGLFATEFIECDELILEYVTSETSKEKPRIAIGEIVYGYNIAALRAVCGTQPTGLSGDCNVNIDCEEGEAWQNEKKSVCYMVQKITGAPSCYMCTGALLNNTAEDFKPLILTALHCGYHNNTLFATQEDLQQWMFYFNRERDGCSNTSLGKVVKSMTGCQLLAGTGLGGGTEGMLLCLKDTIPADYDVYYNGWDRSGDIATSGVCIHHPQGDYKKISTFDAPIQSVTFTGPFTCISNAHWSVVFRETANGWGVTEGGSSGSPLFNEKKLVVGTLSGGPDYNPICNYPWAANLYGKLSYHWDRYKADSTSRMDVWLDPLNKGVKTLSGLSRTLLLPSPLNLKAVNLGQNVSLTWEEPKNSKKPKRYNVYRNNAKISETTYLYYLDENPLVGTIVYSVSAVYDNEEESGFASTTIFLIKYKAPSDLKAERKSNTSNQIELNWTAPFYEQTIYWGTMLATWSVGFDQKFPFYYGQLWAASEIEPLHKKTIKAVQFYPIDKNSYEVYISQGDRTYRQPIDDSSLKPSRLNTINLKTPFVIDGSKSIIVSIYVSRVTTDYPAVGDDGPAINGKGNICSTDGKEWVRFNEGEEPGEYDYNFIIAAVVSSESDDLPDKMLSTRTTERKISQRLMTPRKTMMALDDTPVSLRSSLPAQFPEITKYIIYRAGSYHKVIEAPATSHTDVSAAYNIYYEVSAVYDQVESARSEKAYISTVANDGIGSTSIHITPTLFSDYLSLQGYESVSRIDVVSVSGKVSLVVTNPGQTIHTTSLTPGLYFFRIYDLQNKLTVMKAIKQK